MKCTFATLFLVLSILSFIEAQPGEQGCFPYCANIALGSATLCETEIQANTILACFCDTQYIPNLLSCAQSDCSAADAQTILEQLRGSCEDVSISFPKDTPDLSSSPTSRPGSSADSSLASPEPTEQAESFGGPEPQTLTVTFTKLPNPTQQSSEQVPRTIVTTVTYSGTTGLITSRTRSQTADAPSKSTDSIPNESSTTTTPSDTAEPSKIPISTIVGASIGGFVALSLAALGLWWIIRQNHKKSHLSDTPQAIWSGNTAFTSVSHQHNY